MPTSTSPRPLRVPRMLEEGTRRARERAVATLADFDRRCISQVRRRCKAIARTAAQPSTGGIAPKTPPITMFCGVSGLSTTVWTTAEPTNVPAVSHIVKGLKKT